MANVGQWLAGTGRSTTDAGETRFDEERWTPAKDDCVVTNYE